MTCNLCPRKCNARRTADQNIGGFCAAPQNPKIARADLHFWEEPSISGQNGSGTVFFSGCSLGCVYCQNAEISHGNKGKTISVAELAEIFKALEGRGAHNINLVTPTHYSEAIIEALDIYRPKIPIVYNSSGYETTEQLQRLRSYVDVYLMDFKYINSETAGKYSAAPDYPKIVKAALLAAYRQKGECIFDGQIMQSGVIVRHLLLPQGTNEAIKIFDFVRENMPNAYFSLMAQYMPYGKAADMPPINRKITLREYNKVADYIAQIGFENCYLQSLSSSDEKYIPKFNF